MTIGKSSSWLNKFKDVDKELMKCVERVWPLVISRLTQTELEDKITERLVDILRKDKTACALGFINIQFKLRQEDTEGDFTTKGIIDIVLFLDNDFQKYIAYECKRLNTVSKEGKRIGSLAGKYIQEGVVRYVSAQYSMKLPYGCMIGYVMDGDRDFALQQLKLAIDKKKDLINIEPIKLDVQNGYFTEFETTHRRNYDNSKIVVRHKLLPITP